MCEMKDIMVLLQCLKQLYMSANDKIIFIKWMQSGTVLHLALLKKLSNHYPNGQLSSRFNQFKMWSANKCSPRTPSSYHQLSIQKYECYQGRETFRNTIKPRRKRLENRHKKIPQSSDLNQSVTAWKVENQFQVNYTDKLKRDKYDFFPKLQEHKKDNSFKLHPKEMSSQILKVKNDYNFIIEDVQTENIIRFKSKQKKKKHPPNQSFLLLEEKENQNVHPITICKLKKRDRPNDRSITASPISKRFKFRFQ